MACCRASSSAATAAVLPGSVCSFVVSPGRSLSVCPSRSSSPSTSFSTAPASSWSSSPLSFSVCASRSFRVHSAPAISLLRARSPSPPHSSSPTRSTPHAARSWATREPPSPTSLLFFLLVGLPCSDRRSICSPHVHSLAAGPSPPQLYPSSASSLIYARHLRAL